MQTVTQFLSKPLTVTIEIPHANLHDLLRVALPAALDALDETATDAGCLARRSPDDEEATAAANRADSNAHAANLLTGLLVALNNGKVAS